MLLILNSRGSNGDIISFSDFWPFGADDSDCGIAEISAALRDDLEMMKDIFESYDCGIFSNPDKHVEEVDLSDILEYWVLREYMELIFLRIMIGSIRYQNMISIFLEIDR